MPQLDHLRLIQFRAGYNLPVHAAMEHGIFAAYGLEIEVAYAPGSDYLIAALKSGAFEIGHPAADDVVAAVESAEDRPPDTGVELFLFIGLHSGLLSLIAGPECADVDSLRGKCLGVDSRRTGFVFLLEKLLRSKGFGAPDYSLVEIGGWEFRYRALLERKIAATLLTEPFITDALAGGCHLLARGDEILPVYQATCGAARRLWASDHREALVRYIRAYVAATRWCYEPVNRRACLNLLKQHNGLDDHGAENTLGAILEVERGLYPAAAVNLPGLAAVLELRAETGALKPPIPPPAKYVDLSYYQLAIGGRKNKSET